jgi:hypothetical protein
MAFSGLHSDKRLEDGPKVLENPLMLAGGFEQVGGLAFFGLEFFAQVKVVQWLGLSLSFRLPQGNLWNGLQTLKVYGTRLSA